jgi:hypothetical protein
MITQSCVFIASPPDRGLWQAGSRARDKEQRDEAAAALSANGAPPVSCSPANDASLEVLTMTIRLRFLNVCVALGLALSVSVPAYSATCYGLTPCRACKTCRYCKHCAQNGGTCGVCKAENAKKDTPRSKDAVRGSKLGIKAK